MRVAAVLALGLFAAPASAEAIRADIFDFLAEEACAVGPDLAKRAVAAGVDPGEVRETVERFLDAGSAVRSGPWTVFAAEVCTIRPPRIPSELTLDDPDVRAAISAADARDDVPGCYLDAYALREAKITRRGWQEHRFDRDYMAFLAAGLVSGELAFYSADALSTPRGIQWMTGDGCDAVPNAAAIRENHAWLMTNFDRIVRLGMVHNDCAAGERMSDLAWRSPASLGFAEGENTNAWSMFVLDIIAAGAGWYGPAGHTPNGEPRPPFCAAD